MHMKIEINNPENILPSQKSPEQTQHHGNNPNHSRKNFKPFLKHIHPSQKISSRKNLNLPEKLSLPKNSIPITETISNTRI